MSRILVMGQQLPWEHYLGYATARLAALVVLPIVSRTLGADGLGRFEVALAAMTAATIVLDAGVGAAVIRFAHDRSFPADHLVGAALAVQAGAGLAASLAFVPIMVLLGPAGEPVWAMALVVVLFAVVEGFAVLGSGIVRSAMRNRLFLALSVSRLLLTATFGGLGATVAGVPGALFGVAIGGAGFAGYALLCWRRRATHARLGTRAARRRIAAFGLPLMATTMCTWSLGLSDRLFLQGRVTAEEVGHYSANYRTGAIVLTFLAAPLALAWLPVAQRAEASERRRLTRRWTAGFTAAALACATVLVIACDPLVAIVFGAGFDGDPLIVGMVAVAGWLGGLYYLIATPLLVGDSTRAAATAALWAVAATLGLNAGLISWLEATGAALATLLGYVALCTFTGIAAHRLARTAP